MIQIGYNPFKSSFIRGYLSPPAYEYVFLYYYY